MKLTKLCIILPLLAIMSCGKCVECTQENYDGDNDQYTVYDSNTGNSETFGDRITEICSDNFESKKDFNDYIDEIEKEYDYTCKNDFLN